MQDSGAVTVEPFAQSAKESLSVAGAFPVKEGGSYEQAQPCAIRVGSASNVTGADAMRASYDSQVGETLHWSCIEGGRIQPHAKAGSGG